MRLRGWRRTREQSRVLHRAHARSSSPASFHFALEDWPTVIGVASGTGAALCWALGLAAARHGILIGFAPADIAFHRFIWAGLVFLPFFAQDAVQLIGWSKSVLLTLAGGPLVASLSYA